MRARLKEKEHKFGGPLRKETWIHPSGGRRIHRTTPLDLGTATAAGKSGDTSDEEELDAMSTADVGHRITITAREYIVKIPREMMVMIMSDLLYYGRFNRVLLFVCHSFVSSCGTPPHLQLSDLGAELPIRDRELLAVYLMYLWRQALI